MAGAERPVGFGPRSSSMGSIMCLDVAFAEWVSSDGKKSLNDLLDAAFNEPR